MKLPTIAFLSGNDSWGGSETWWFRLALEALLRGCRAIVMVRKYVGNESWRNQLQTAGIEVVEFTSDSPAQIDRFLGRESIDIFHVNLGWPFRLLEECERICAFGVPLVLVEHLAPDSLENPAGDDRMELKRAVYSKAAHVVFVSERNRNVMSACMSPETPVSVIRNGVDLKSFRPGPFRSGREVRCVCVARLDVGHKGQDVLLKAVYLARRGGSNIQLDLIGEGPSKGGIRELIDLLNLGSAVRLLGHRDRVEEMLPLYDIFVLLSRREGTPIAIAEGKACGLPCVVSDAGGNGELVADGVTGYVVPREDEHLAAQRLLYLEREPEVRYAMREQSLAAAARDPDVNKMLDGMFEIYSTVTGRLERPLTRNRECTL